MKNSVTYYFLTILLQLNAVWCMAQFKIDESNRNPYWSLNGERLLSAPEEGLWSIATDWQQDWMEGWKHAQPEKVEESGDWVIVSGKMMLSLIHI